MEGRPISTTHRGGGHLVGCAVGIALALAVVAVTGGSAGGLGVLVAALACPLAMVVAMRLLMGDQPDHRHCAHGPAEAPEAPEPERQPS